MTKHFTWILLTIASLAHAMNEPKDDDGIVIKQTSAPTTTPPTRSEEDDETTETPQDTIQWLYDHRLNKSYYLSDDFIVTEDAAESSMPTNAAAATGSKTPDVKPAANPAATPQTTSDNKKSYCPKLQYDPERHVYFIPLIPEKSHYKHQAETKTAEKKDGSR